MNVRRARISIGPRQLKDPVSQSRYRNSPTPAIFRGDKGRLNQTKRPRPGTVGLIPAEDPHGEEETRGQPYSRSAQVEPLGPRNGAEEALNGQASHVGLVASPRRGRAVVDYLQGKGVPFEALPRVKYPAGMDIGAEMPEEIALSILAEIVQAVGE